MAHGTVLGSNESTSRFTDSVERFSKKSPPEDVMEWMSAARLKSSYQTLEVDVVTVEPDEHLYNRTGAKKFEEVDKCSVLLCGEPWVTGLSEHMRREAGQVGARLGLESLVPGGAPQALATTLLSILTATFAEDLLRRALSATYLRGGSCISPADVCQAICQRKEFDLLTQQGLQVNLLPNDYLRKKEAKPEEPP